ncbi:uncharacterized protein G2W53_029507 [Senna tora]|uniref:Uncharacterized protein n=1 Tax=Senna tora TaxID=362788 RepID=A0A834WBX5_9FABA|nr:uncharacterized protein G2W53_029507 [Senna tora]
MGRIGSRSIVGSSVSTNPRKN